MKIEVTEQDIEMGQPEVACSCPVSLAVQRATNAARVWTGFTDGSTRVKITGADDGSLNGYWEAPEIVKDFVGRFDAGNVVEPFSFDLAIRPGDDL